MADLKNQHFVPRCLFKPFTSRQEGKAINLYNIRHQKLVDDRAAGAGGARHARRAAGGEAPVYRRWWLWTTVAAVVVVGAGVGLGIGLTRTPAAPSVATQDGTFHPF